MSIAKDVFRWIDENPFVIYGLKKDVINYSSLARTIQKDMKIGNFDAVIMAIRRYSQKPGILKSDGKNIIKIIRDSSLEVRTGINVYITREKIQGNFIHLIKSGEFTTIVSDEKLDINSLKMHENVIEVRVKSPVNVEKTPGVVAFIYNSIAEAGINIIETYSCYSDTILIFDKKDFMRAVEVFDKLGIK